MLAATAPAAKPRQTIPPKVSDSGSQGGSAAPLAR